MFPKLLPNMPTYFSDWKSIIINGKNAFTFASNLYIGKSLPFFKQGVLTDF